jgi:surface polysaccharide O-acyltransferase-like enzyme
MSTSEKKSWNGPTLTELQGQEQVNETLTVTEPIHGWLTFLIVGMTIGTLRSLLEMATTIRSGDKIDTAIHLLSAVLSGSGAWFLSRRDKRGVTIAYVFFGFVFLVSAVLLVFEGLGSDGGALAYLVGSVIQLAYLIRSKQVQAVYYGETK